MKTGVMSALWMAESAKVRLIGGIFCPFPVHPQRGIGRNPHG